MGITESELPLPIVEGDSYLTPDLVHNKLLINQTSPLSLLM